MKTVQVPKQVSYLICFFVGPSHSFTDQETQEENLLGGTNSFAGQFLHPLLQSSRSIQLMQTVQVPKQVSYFQPVFEGPSRSFTDQETQEENLLGGINSFAGQFLDRKSVV